uniref:KASH domain-containing protein n=1 Tax=Schistocephalus solidus TaxID=70667 RepID=A0A183TP28_SCHSO
LHDEAVSRRKLIFSVAEDLSRLKSSGSAGGAGSFHAQTGSDAVRTLELELADAYSDLMEQCQSQLRFEREAFRCSQTAMQDAQSAIAAVESLSQRAVSLLYHDLDEPPHFSTPSFDVSDSHRPDLARSVDWQLTCLSDFLSIELSTVQEIVDRSKDWTSSLPEPDCRLADTLAQRLTGELQQINSLVEWRVSALRDFADKVKALSQCLSVEEAWDREFVSTALGGAILKQAPNSLREKQEQVHKLEAHLARLEEHVAAVKELAEEIGLPIVVCVPEQETPFSAPSDLMKRVHCLAQRLTQQGRDIRQQISRWKLDTEQYRDFIIHLSLVYHKVAAFDKDFDRLWDTFKTSADLGSASTCPDSVLVAWAEETLTRNFVPCLGRIREDLRRLAQKLFLLTATTGASKLVLFESQQQLLQERVEHAEATLSTRLSLLISLATRLDDFSRARFHSKARVTTCESRLAELLAHQGAPRDPAALAFRLQMLYDEVEAGLSAETNLLAEYSSDLRDLSLELVASSSSVNLLPPLQLDDEDLEAIEAGTELAETSTSDVFFPPPESCPVDTALVASDLRQVFEKLKKSIWAVRESCEAVISAEIQYRAAKQACQLWLSETRKNLTTCVSVDQRNPQQPLTLDQKINQLRSRQQRISVN